MLNHTYTSVKNANLVDCGKKQHIPSQPSALLRDNYLGEYRTELDKKKVLANLGIATSLSLKWENIKGNIGDNKDLIGELNTRTTYVTEIGDFQGSVISIVDGIKYLETIVGGEQEGEDGQNQRLTALETLTGELVTDLDEVKEYLTETIEVDIDKLEEDLGTITEKVNNITDLIQVSSKAGNALRLVSEDELAEGETPGLYVPDLSDEVSTVTDNVTTLQTEVRTILDTYVTKEQLGGGTDGFNFVDESTYSSFVNYTSESLSDIRKELNNTVKTGADGHVNALYVNEIGKNNNDGNIKITDSFEVTEGIPLDVRAVVEDLDALHNLSYTICYPGMGVIVKNLDSLYILKNPSEGVAFNQDYVSNEYNWKCPEDLVTVPLTRNDYELLVQRNEINPNVFYYIYEEEFTLTKPPRIEDFDSPVEFEEAYSIWQSQVKELDQQYVSASWGLEIEDLLSKKASAEALNKLKQEVISIKGDGEGPSLGNLGKSIENLQNEQQELSDKIDTIINDSDKSGRLNIAETNISNISNNLFNYVTKSELQDESNDFIFVKTSDYTEDKEELLESLAESITTKTLVSNSIDADAINTDSITLTQTEVSVGDLHLLVNKQPVAFTSELMKVRILTQSDYDDIPESEIEQDVYYYTYEDETPMATKAELQKALNRISKLETDLMLLSQEFNKFIQAQQS